jgi:hypothetical protein
MVGNDNYKSALKFNALFFPPQGTVLAVPPPLMSISAMSLGEKLLKAVSVRAVFSALVTCANAPVTSVPRTATYKIDYRNNNLINKPTIPTLPAEITDAQVDSGVGTDEVGNSCKVCR